MPEEKNINPNVEPTFSGALNPYLRKTRIVIHTMPKRFIDSTKHRAGRSKHIGIIILAVGVLLLAVLFGFFYIFISNGGSSVSLLLRPVSPEKENNSKINQPQIEADNEQITAPIDEKPDGIQADDVKQLDEQATTSVQIEPILATSTQEEKTEPVEVIDSSPATTSVVTEIIPAADIDRDGLSDIEELVLGTNAQSIDSDNDSYDDYSELMNLYNPAGMGMIIVNPNIDKYTNSVYQYTLYHPSSWKVETIGGADSVLFRLANNQFIQVIVQANTEKETVENWYSTQFDDKIIKPEQRIYKKGWAGIRSEDELVVYLMHPAQSYIFTVTYNIGVQKSADYKGVFEMMVKSLEITN